jgi:hypothetical protein
MYENKHKWFMRSMIGTYSWSGTILCGRSTKVVKKTRKNIVNGMKLKDTLCDQISFSFQKGRHAEFFFLSKIINVTYMLKRYKY